MKRAILQAHYYVLCSHCYLFLLLRKICKSNFIHTDLRLQACNSQHTGMLSSTKIQISWVQEVNSDLYSQNSASTLLPISNLVTMSLLGTYLFNIGEFGADLFKFYFLFKSEKGKEMQK